VFALTTTYLFLDMFLLEGLGRDVIRDRVLYRWRLAFGLDVSVLVAALHVVLVGVLFYWAATRATDGLSPAASE
jgi:hypothetical protein